MHIGRNTRRRRRRRLLTSRIVSFDPLPDDFLFDAVGAAGCLPLGADDWGVSTAGAADAPAPAAAAPPPPPPPSCFTGKEVHGRETYRITRQDRGNRVETYVCVPMADVATAQ